MPTHTLFPTPLNNPGPAHHNLNPSTFARRASSLTQLPCLLRSMPLAATSCSWEVCLPSTHKAASLKTTSPASAASRATLLQSTLHRSPIQHLVVKPRQSRSEQCKTYSFAVFGSFEVRMTRCLGGRCLGSAPEIRACLAYTLGCDRVWARDFRDVLGLV